MTPIELIADHIKGTCGLIPAALSDFSEADMLVRPVPGANHALWQLGHVASAIPFFLSPFGADLPALPEGFADKYGGKNAGSDDPKSFDSKEELLALFDSMAQAAVAFARTRTAEDLATPTTGPVAQFAPNLGHALLAMATHAMMHWGQFSVIRRKLGKPVLF